MVRQFILLGFFLQVSFQASEDGLRQKVFPAFGSVVQDNLIENGSFEAEQDQAKPVGWSYAVSSGSAVQYIKSGVAGEEVHRGTHAVALKGNVSSDRWFVINNNLPAVEAGKSYRLSVWLKTDNFGLNGAACLTFNYLDQSGGGSGMPGAPSAVVTGTKGWGQMSVEFTVPSGGFFIRPSLSMYSLGGDLNPDARAIFDDITLVEIPSALLQQNPVTNLLSADLECFLPFSGSAWSVVSNWTNFSGWTATNGSIQLVYADQAMRVAAATSEEVIRLLPPQPLELPSDTRRIRSWLARLQGEFSLRYVLQDSQNQEHIVESLNSYPFMGSSTAESRQQERWSVWEQHYSMNFSQPSSFEIDFRVVPEKQTAASSYLWPKPLRLKAIEVCPLNAGTDSVEFWITTPYVLTQSEREVSYSWYNASRWRVGWDESAVVFPDDFIEMPGQYRYRLEISEGYHGPVIWRHEGSSGIYRQDDPLRLLRDAIELPMLPCGFYSIFLKSWDQNNILSREQRFSFYVQQSPEKNTLSPESSKFSIETGQAGNVFDSGTDQVSLYVTAGPLPAWAKRIQLQAEDWRGDEVCNQFFAVNDSVLTEDFETGSAYPGDWRYTVNTNATAAYITNGVSGGTVFEGSRAVCIVNPAGAYDRWYLRDAGVPSVTNGLEYTLSAMVKTENMTNTRAYIQMVWLNSAKTAISGASVESLPVTEDQDWEVLCVSGTAPAGAVYMRPQLVFRPIDTGLPVGAGAKATFDAVQIFSTDFSSLVSTGVPVRAVDFYAMATLFDQNDQILDRARLHFGVASDSVAESGFVMPVSSSGTAGQVFLAEFEAGSVYPGDWRYTVNTNATAAYITNGVSGGTVFEGSRAVCIVNPAGAYDRWYIRDAGVPCVTNGLEYTFSVMVKTENMTNTRAYIQIVWLDSAKKAISGASVESLPVEEDQDWELLCVSGAAPAGAVYMRPQLVFRPVDTGLPAGTGAKATFDLARITVPPAAEVQLSSEYNRPHLSRTFAQYPSTPWTPPHQLTYYDIWLTNQVGARGFPEVSVMLPWADIEVLPGVYRWEEPDRRIQVTASAGLDIVAWLGVLGDWPPWAPDWWPGELRVSQAGRPDEVGSSTINSRNPEPSMYTAEGTHLLLPWFEAGVRHVRSNPAVASYKLMLPAANWMALPKRGYDNSSYDYSSGVEEAFRGWLTDHGKEPRPLPGHLSFFDAPLQTLGPDLSEEWQNYCRFLVDHTKTVFYQVLRRLRQLDPVRPVAVYRSQNPAFESLLPLMKKYNACFFDESGPNFFSSAHASMSAQAGVKYANENHYYMPSSREIVDANIFYGAIYNQGWSYSYRWHERHTGAEARFYDALDHLAQSQAVIAGYASARSDFPQVLVFGSRSDQLLNNDQSTRFWKISGVDLFTGLFSYFQVLPHFANEYTEWIDFQDFKMVFVCGDVMTQSAIEKVVDYAQKGGKIAVVGNAGKYCPETPAATNSLSSALSLFSTNVVRFLGALNTTPPGPGMAPEAARSADPAAMEALLSWAGVSRDISVVTANGLDKRFECLIRRIDEDSFYVSVFRRAPDDKSGPYNSWYNALMLADVSLIKWGQEVADIVVSAMPPGDYMLEKVHRESKNLGTFSVTNGVLEFQADAAVLGELQLYKVSRQQ